MRGFLRAVLRETGARAAGVACLLLLSGLVEAAGVVTLVPLLGLVGLDLGGALDPAARAVRAALESAGVRPSLASVLILFVALAAGQAFLARWQATASAGLAAGFVAGTRRRLYGALARTRWAFHSRARASDFVHALTTEADRAGTALSFAVSLASEAVLAVVYLAVALRVSPPLTAATAAAGGTLLWLLRRQVRASHAGGEAITEATAAYHARMAEHLAGARLARAFGNAARHEEAFGALADRVAAEERGAVRAWAATRFWFSAGTVAALALLVFASVEILAVPPATLLLLLFLYARLMHRAGSLQQYAQYLQGALPAWGRVARLEEECRREAAPGAGGREPAAFRRELRLEGVSFAFREGGPHAVSGVDLSVLPGTTVAVVGPSGAGKSTLADIVTGLLPPDEGRVLLDGEPLGPARLASWQEAIGVVPQEPFLFHDTVRANLLWARPAATDADLEEALRTADAGDLVRGLPAGLDTVVGDRGATLSGGERQRIALARALLRRPPLLVLDEATSSLDPESEGRIRAAIEGLRGRLAILVIAHRLSAVRGADAIHVMEAGRIVESGTFDGLVARPGGRLRAMAAAQGIPVPPANG